MILRPLAVSILLRNPCSDLRRRLLGWYVRFTFNPLYCLSDNKKTTIPQTPDKSQEKKRAILHKKGLK